MNREGLSREGRPSLSDREGRPSIGDREGRPSLGDREGRPSVGDRGDRGPSLRDGDRGPRTGRPEFDTDRLRQLRENPRSATENRQNWRDSFNRELGSRIDGRGRPPIERTVSNREYFNRFQGNQSLSHLRLRDPSAVARIARDPRNPHHWLRNQNYRLRPLHNNVNINIRVRGGRPINFATFGPGIARRMVWWRGLQIGGWYRWNRANFMYYDFWGRPMGLYYRNIFRPGAMFMVPHYNRFYRGSYVVYNDHHYYYPETFAMSAELPSEEIPEPVQMDYGDFSFVRDLAYRFERMVNSICLELYYNYRDNPEFETVYREAYDLLLASKEILAAAEQGDQQTAGEWLYGLDQLFYHVLDRVADWERTEQKQIDEGDVLSKIALAEATLQHLMYDVGVEPSFEIVEDDAPLPGVGDSESPAPMIELPPIRD